jgi:DNA-binding MarR family transcriptional regulator
MRTTETASQLRFAVMRLSRRLRQHSVEDTTPSQLSALTALARDGRLTLSQLAEVERVQPPTITRIVEGLVGRGLVERIPSDSDRRVTYVAATAEGRALIERIRRRRDAYLAQRLGRLAPEERELLAKAAVLLERLAEEPAP